MNNQKQDASKVEDILVNQYIDQMDHIKWEVY